jgi:beta-RFAP synthase
MPAGFVRIIAPSRLHFGLLSFGGGARQFGGVGVMVQRPSIELHIGAGERLEVSGPLANRVKRFARRWARFFHVEKPACRIEVAAAPREHVGLGVGTQLGLSVAAGLNAFFERGSLSPAEMALSVGRGLRSAVGSYGFALGGLIVERGKLPGEAISPLECRLKLPDRWRFVLICPRRAEGLSGAAERTAFAQLPAVPTEVTLRLIEELLHHMLPAVAEARFTTFSESVYRFGNLAGECFASLQGGAYNGPLLRELVSTLRGWGIRGVGQSSWGPTLFALSPDPRQARELADKVAAHYGDQQFEIQISSPCNRGARVEVVRL